MYMKSATKLFSTTDLALGAFLRTSGFVLEQTDRSNARRIAFLFEDSAQLREAVDGFWSGSLKVEPTAYFQAIKDLKNRIYGGS